MPEKSLARFPDLPSAWANIIDRIDFQPCVRGRAQVGGGLHAHVLVRRRPCVGVRSLRHVQAKAVEISIEACSLKSQWTFLGDFFIFSKTTSIICFLLK